MNVTFKVLVIWHFYCAISVATALARPASPVCQNMYCQEFVLGVTGQNIVSPHQVTVVCLGRNGTGTNDKILTKVQRIDRMTTIPGQNCHAIICHEGRSSVGGHWVTLLKIQGRWWKSDSNFHRPQRMLIDPFESQLRSGQLPQPGEYTLDAFWFSNNLGPQQQ